MNESERVAIGRIARAAEKLAATFDRGNGQIHYKFDPQDDMTLSDVIALLKTLNINADSEEYTHHDFPPALKRHFRPTTP